MYLRRFLVITLRALLFLIPCILIIHIPQTHAAVSFYASSTRIITGFSAGPTTATTTMTISSNANRIVVECAEIWQDTGGTGTITATTFGGSNLTKAVTSTVSTSMAVEAWYLVNPSSGSQRATTTVTGARDAVKIDWVEFDGVDQTNPIDATSTNTGALANSTTTIVTANNNSMLDECISLFGTATLTVRNSATVIVQEHAASTNYDASYKLTTTAGSYNMGWTWTGNNDWSEAVISLKPAATTLPPPPLKYWFNGIFQFLGNFWFQ